MLFDSLRATEGESEGYNVEQLCVRLSGELDIAGLELAYAALAQRWPQLNSEFFLDVAGTPRRRERAPAPLRVEHRRWTGLSESERHEAHRAFLCADRRTRFELSRAPLSRLSVLQAEGDAELVWTFHHVLMDGASMSAALTELLALCGLEVARPPLAAKSGGPEAARAAPEPASAHLHFERLLAGKTAPTPLPGGGKGRLVGSSLATLHATRIDADLFEKLVQATSAEGLKTSDLIHAAWALALGRYTGDDDVLFGSIRSFGGAPPDGVNPPLGLFVNTLPMRARLVPDKSLRELLRELREQSRALREYARTPLSDVRTHCEIPAAQPLFESLVNFESGGVSAGIRRALGPRCLDCSLYEKPTVPLSLVCSTEDGALSLRLLCDPKRVSEATASRLLASLGVLFEQFARGFGTHLRDLELLPQAEIERLLVTFNATERAFPDQQRIHDAFEAQVALRPDATAIVYEQTRLSYGALEALSNRIANLLIERGVGSGRFVAVCLTRSPLLVAALLGVCKAGAAYVPLDFRHPAARLRFLVEDCGADFVLTEAALAHLFACALTLDGPLLDAQSSARPAPRSAATDPCYAIFTSGSTGEPKAVLLAHRAVVNTLDWVNRSFAVGPEDRGLMISPATFDLSVYDVFGLLGAGATLVMPSEDAVKDPAALHRLLISERVSLWNSAPAALSQLDASLRSEAPSDALRLVLLSGDFTPLSLPGLLRNAFPRAEIVSLGGATEAAIWSNWFSIGAIDPQWASIPYGRPIQNARYYVLDGDLRVLPVGVAGDLYIAGECLAQGYLAREQLTRERFFEASLPLGVRERLYKTGDVARHTESGDLELLGRSDAQVKIRGFRVETGEVEVALLALDEVREALCTTRTDAQGDKALVAYLVLRPDAAFDERKARARLAERLPSYMIPSPLIVLSRFPLTRSGKIDRSALPTGVPAARGQAPVAARNRQEEILVRVWEELLDHRPVGVQDDFFAIGGHSLSALALLSRARAELALEVALPRFLEQPTIEGMLMDPTGESAGVQRSARVWAVHTRGERPPIVLLARGAFMLLYREFAKLFGRDQPVYLLQVGGNSDGDPARLLAQCERELTAICPTGPLVIGGFRNDAAIGYRLARKLHTRARRVLLVVSIDGELDVVRTGERSWAGRTEGFVRALGRAVRGVRREHARAPMAAREDVAVLQIASEQSGSGSLFAARVGDADGLLASVETLAVPGGHMSFLANGKSPEVVAAIARRIDRGL